MTTPEPQPTSGTARRSLLLGAAAATLAAPAVRAQAPGLVVAGTNGWLFTVWDKANDWPLENMRLANPLISQAIGIMRGAGIQMSILLIPSKTVLYKQFLPPNVRFQADLDRRYGIAMEEFRRAGAIVPDIQATFRARQSAVQLWFKTDSHWTPMAAEIAAVEMAKAVGPTLPPSSRPGTQVTTLINRQLPRGDLVRLLPQGQRDAYGMEPYQVREIASSGSQNDLIADDTADVALIGNSYVEPRYLFQPILSNQLMRPVSLFWKPNNVGPWATILQYLSSDLFKQQRPKVIIWTHLELDLIAGPSSGGWSQNAMPPERFISELRRGVGA
ncbi:alginate O-acetyltransferase AlgX-related protein [Roseomonas populi]|uniref:AlgX/AlgJ SGNH hydrolase-like domain-containing protein n=1 Tax=Roseomonas populi TaxID=3121582 RepID=A0ABT1X2X7_9PROT|nr:hypothetical protein [Roseomonas pecuniae]MCR0982468.1 hypothetical protein [Roseomonas pecuniae]